MNFIYTVLRLVTSNFYYCSPELLSQNILQLYILSRLMVLIVYVLVSLHAVYVGINAASVQHNDGFFPVLYC